MAHDHSHGSGSRRQLAIVFAIVTTIFVFQLIGSVVTGSLALLIDTGHNAVDLIGIGIALFAATLVHKPAGGQKTWGFRRAEVLAAGAQATLLLGLGVYSLIEGIRRFFVPSDVPGPGLLLCGAIVAVGNCVWFVILRSSQEDSVILSAAFLQVIAVALGFVAVILAALAISLFGWERADAVAVLFISALI